MSYYQLIEKLEIVSGVAPPPFRIFAGGPPRPDLASGRNAFGLIQEYCTTYRGYARTSVILWEFD